MLTRPPAVEAKLEKPADVENQQLASLPLPDEIISYIFSYLSARDVVAASAVSRNFNAVSLLQWQQLFIRYFPELVKSISKQSKIDWRAEFATAISFAGIREQTEKYITHRGQEPGYRRLDGMFSTLPHKLGFSHEKLAAAACLLNVIDKKCSADTLKDHLGALTEGELGRIYDHYRKVVSIRHQFFKNEFQKHDEQADKISEAKLKFII